MATPSPLPPAPPSADPAPYAARKRRSKRKAEVELSDNAFSKTCRAYVASLTDVELQAKKAVDADRAIKGAWRRAFVKKAEYLNASARDRETLLQEHIAGKWAEREAEGKTATQVKARLAIMDVDDEEQEKLWRGDEAAEGLQQSLKVDDEIAQDVRARVQTRARLSVFRAWALHWLKVMASVEKKEKVGPAVFTAEEKMIWRLVAAIDGKGPEAEWIALPGGEEEWPEGFDYM
ncbi:MAG: hypothetical protein M1816_006715 [Peltula sp. TS41687]|nr:MAG: hypothetical protein M1816_006715 [Peltula sp. TS41687]